jgi:cyanate permease
MGLRRILAQSPFSTLYGFTWTGYAIAGAIGPVVMGRAFDITGSYAVFLSVLAFAGLVSALLMLTMPQYDRTVPTAPLAVPAATSL